MAKRLDANQKEQPISAAQLGRLSSLIASGRESGALKAIAATFTWHDDDVNRREF